LQFNPLTLNGFAAGALICGALIAASTIFYIIQKKKISVHKPAFSRIPTGGK
jgi:hypothetical protein